MASNNHRAGGSFPKINASKIIFEAPDTNRDVIVRFIVAEGTVNPSADANWGFASLPVTSVLFDTWPKRKAFVKDVKGVRIEEAGEGEGGFARYWILL